MVKSKLVRKIANLCKSVNILLLLLLCFFQCDAKCRSGCDLALASYYVWPGTNLSYITEIFDQRAEEILRYNPGVQPDGILAGTRVRIPFACECLNGDFLGHTFEYETRSGDTYDKIARVAFSNLTTGEWIRVVNHYDPTRLPDSAVINVTVNCSCGNGRVSRDYGLFSTYPLRDAENMTSVAATAAEGVSPELLRRFNPGASFGAGSGIVFLPAKDQNGTYPKLKSSSSGISGGTIAGISVAAVLGVAFMAFCFYIFCYRERKKTGKFYPEGEPYGLNHKHMHAPEMLEKISESGPPVAGTPRLNGITVDKSMEFSYEELAKATENFSLANKIGQGGFGSVFYGELRGEKAAVKKMDMQASKEFLAELKVLTHVHHLNLVRLIGYCVEGSLFLVYEFIENGNLTQHLRNSEREVEPLPWSTRVQIALDSARGLEYIHEHTVPVYIHRDIKSANILIDENYRAKVADFGLTKLTEVGSTSLHTRLVGTFGYMPPEYAQYGDVTPKIDVYAFGVVLYELISAKEAIVKTNELVSESRGLVALFEDAFNKPDPQEAIVKLIDPRLNGEYPIDSARKMAQLARVCTHENPQLRPSMRSIVVALMTLSSTTEDWDIGSFYENQGLGHLMSGR